MQRVAARARGTARRSSCRRRSRILAPGSIRWALAVALYLRVAVTAVIDDGRGRLTCRFLDGPLGGPNRIERAFKALRPRTAARRRRSQVEVRSEIPLRVGAGQQRGRDRSRGCGCGNSSTAAVPGTKSSPRRRRSRGIPTTRPPALFGGVTSCCARGDGPIDGDEVAVAVAVAHRGRDAGGRAGDRRFRAARCRRSCRSRDVVFNMQHVALLLGALQSGRARGFARSAPRPRPSALSRSGWCRACADCWRCGILT